MPELPEVETIKRGLEQLVLGKTVKSVQWNRKDLRFPIPVQIKRLFRGQEIVSLQRRAKYLLLFGPEWMLLSHLGMTGSWRVYESNDHRLHDHIMLTFDDGMALVYNDPRRFGFVDIVPSHQWEAARWFSHLGLEPLSEEFNSEYLWMKTRHKNGVIKSLLMDQKVVVGVGNIYASEALYRSGVRPVRRSGNISKAEIKRLVSSIKEVLAAAIHSGGTTIRDFRQAGGSEGYFQTQLLVYGRDGQPCVDCLSLLKSVIICGRSSFYCSQCQK